MQRSIERWLDNTADDYNVALLNWLLENSLLDEPSHAVSPIPDTWTRYRETEESQTSPQRAPAIADGSGEDEFVLPMSMALTQSAP